MTTRKYITGNLAGDPELAFSGAGKAWARFTVISNDGKDDNAVKCVTRCKAFGEIAEHVAESLTRGTRVIVHGREVTEEWDKDGEKRSANVLLVDSVGPDLRWATAKVTRTQASAPATPSANDPWASAPAGEENPPW